MAMAVWWCLSLLFVVVFILVVITNVVKCRLQPSYFESLFYMFVAYLTRTVTFTVVFWVIMTFI